MARFSGKYKDPMGMVWFAGWLFSLGYADLNLLSGLLAIFIWPYYLGVALISG